MAYKDLPLRDEIDTAYEHAKRTGKVTVSPFRSPKEIER